MRQQGLHWRAAGAHQEPRSGPATGIARINVKTAKRSSKAALYHLKDRFRQARNVNVNSSSDIKSCEGASNHATRHQEVLHGRGNEEGALVPMHAAVPASQSRAFMTRWSESASPAGPEMNRVHLKALSWRTKTPCARESKGVGGARAPRRASARGANHVVHLQLINRFPKRLRPKLAAEPLHDV
jgi:hypothetical protein